MRPTRFPIPLDAFDDLIDGCEQDSIGTTYKTVDELVGYCRLVAGSVGRLSLGVFGASDLATAMPLADDLGVALQLTNVLRDVAEDRAMGRVYLPATDLAEFGCVADASGPRRRWPSSCASSAPAPVRGIAAASPCCRTSIGAAARARRRWPASISGCSVASSADPTVVLDRRVSLPVRHKVAVAAKAITLGKP